jgi:GT2 family glycosyltransferase
MNWPKVTVYTLIYNTNPKYIIESIESIRANNYPNLQHIIIDDCSPSASCREVVKNWIQENQYNCQFIEHEYNYGIVKSVNHALELANGKYILGCCDDIILPGRIYEDVKEFENLSETYAVVYSVAQFIDEKSRKKARLFPEFSLHIESIPDDIRDMLFTYNIICAPAAMVKTDVLRELGCYDESFLFEDYPMWFALLEKGYRFRFVPEIRTLYRFHADSFSNAKRLESIMESGRIQLYFARNDSDFNKIRMNIVRTFKSSEKDITQKFIKQYSGYCKLNISLQIIRILLKIRIPITQAILLYDLIAELRRLIALCFKHIKITPRSVKKLGQV